MSMDASNNFLSNDFPTYNDFLINYQESENFNVEVLEKLEEEVPYITQIIIEKMKFHHGKIIFLMKGNDLIDVGKSLQSLNICKLTPNELQDEDKILKKIAYNFFTEGKPYFEEVFCRKMFTKIEGEIIDNSSQSFNKQGKVIPANDSGYQILLNGLKDPRFGLKIIGVDELVDLPDKLCGYKKGRVSFVIDNNLIDVSPETPYLRIYVDLDEMSDRLLISKDKIEKNALEGSLGFLLDYKSEKLKSLAHTIDNYEKIICNYELNPTGELLLKNRAEGLAAGLTSNQIMKIIRTYYKVDPSESFESSGNPWNNKSSVLLSFQEKHGQLANFKAIAKLHNKELKLIRLDTAQQLGAGTYGVVYLVERIDNASKTALKLAKAKSLDNTDKAIIDLKKEMTILRALAIDAKRKGITLIGIQDPPHVVIDLNRSNDKYFGYSGPLYDSDMASYLTRHKNKEAKFLVDACTQIVIGAAYLADVGIVNVDNKLENVLVREVLRDGKLYKIIAHNSDFGGAQFESEIQISPHLVHTIKYFPLGDLNNISLKIRSKNLAEYVNALKALEVFQRGVIVYAILMGEFPFPFIKDKGVAYGRPHVSISGQSEKLIAKGYNPALASLIVRMIDSSPSARPNAHEVKELWLGYAPNLIS